MEVVRCVLWVQKAEEHTGFLFFLFSVARDARLLFDPECDFLTARLTVSFTAHLVRTG